MPPAPAFILPSQRVEPYQDIEIRLQAPVTFIQNSPHQFHNVDEVARTYEIPVTRLRGCLQGRHSRHERQGVNRRLSADQEQAIGQYLYRLDAIGPSAHLQIVTSCVNSILAYGHTSSGPAPLVGDHWASRFLDRYLEYHVRK